MGSRNGPLKVLGQQRKENPIITCTRWIQKPGLESQREALSDHAQAGCRHVAWLEVQVCSV